MKEKIAKAKDMGLKNLILTGQEVVLHPNIGEIIEYAFAEAGMNYITFNTNGLAFSSDKVITQLGELPDVFLEKTYIAVSLNFYDKKSFNDWSGHSGEKYKDWITGFQKAVSHEKINISSVDIILRRNTRIFKVLDFLKRITNGKTDYKEGVRILNLLPLTGVNDDYYKKAKYNLIETSKKISDITDNYSGRIHFESFPICVFNQKSLYNEEYYIYNFYPKVEKGVLVQYDPNIYETYFDGPTENWLIEKEKVREAYKKMFSYVDECRGCPYLGKCYGVQQKYIKMNKKEKINQEIKKLKERNWKSYEDPKEI